MAQVYAVIFTAEFSGNLDGYDAMLARLRGLVERQPGFLGIESVTEGRREVTVSYWDSLDAIRAWKAQPEHRRAQELARSTWYRSYKVEIAAVERSYTFGE